MKIETIPFLGQSEPCAHHIKELIESGLVVPDETTRRCASYKVQLANATAGDVVSYKPLAAKLRDDQVSPEDAAALLWLEGNRKHGRPREMHIDRLLIVAFSDIKDEILKALYS